MTTPNSPNRSEIETENVSGENRNQNDDEVIDIPRCQNPHRPVLDQRSAPYYPLQHGHNARLTETPATHQYPVYNQPFCYAPQFHSNRPLMVTPAPYQYYMYNQPNSALQYRSPYSYSPLMETPATHQYYMYNQPSFAPHYRSPQSTGTFCLSVGPGHSPMMETPATHQYSTYSLPSSASQLLFMDTPATTHQYSISNQSSSVPQFLPIETPPTTHRHSILLQHPPPFPLMETPATIPQYYILNQPSSASQLPLMETPATTHQHYIDNQPYPAPQYHSPHNNTGGWYPNYDYNQTTDDSIPYRPRINTQHDYNNVHLNSSRPEHSQNQIYVRNHNSPRLTGGNVHKKYRNEGPSEINPAFLIDYNSINDHGNSSTDPTSPRPFRYGGNVHLKYYRPESLPSGYYYNPRLKKYEYRRNEEDETPIIQNGPEEETSEPGAIGRCEICNVDFEVGPVESQESSSFRFPMVSVLPCGHVFHSECLTENPEAPVLPHPSCPTCSKDEVSDITQGVQSLDITKNSTE